MLLNRIFLFRRVNGGKIYGFHLGVTGQQGSLFYRETLKGTLLNI